MSGAVKPAKKTAAPREHALTATEAYQLAPMQQALHEAQERYARAVRQLQGLAVGVLDRGGEKDTDPNGWQFDVRDAGVFLVRAEVSE